MIDEGVIKFALDHAREPLAAHRFEDLASELSAWRDVLHKTRLIGELRVPTALGYGNISGRTGAPSAPRGSRAFLISGSQTGGLVRLGLDQFALVESYNYRLNKVESRGLVDPSSESMTHGAVYDLSAHIRYVVHGHSSEIWSQAKRLGLPTVSAEVRYGTPEMAYAVAQLYRETALEQRQIFAMAGHEDGIVSFGGSLEEASLVIIKELARAYQHERRR